MFSFVLNWVMKATETEKKNNETHLQACYFSARKGAFMIRQNARRTTFYYLYYECELR
jgi:hypothetical protein